MQNGKKLCHFRGLDQAWQSFAVRNRPCGNIRRLIRVNQVGQLFDCGGRLWGRISAQTIPHQFSGFLHERRRVLVIRDRRGPDFGDGQRAALGLKLGHGLPEFAAEDHIHDERGQNYQNQQRANADSQPFQDFLNDFHGHPPFCCNCSAEENDNYEIREKRENGRNKFLDVQSQLS
ncbi:MAG: hypothetical protein WC381_01965 [Kiritimatiellia bacterium]